MTTTRERALEAALQRLVTVVEPMFVIRRHDDALMQATKALTLPPDAPPAAPAATGDHTPGPWLVGYGGTTCSVYFAPAHKITWNKKNAVATFDRSDEGKANARLIAAAPDMLAALQLVAPKIARKKPFTFGDLQVVSAAIARATGKGA